MTKIIRRAGLDPWPKLWQNLRASRQTELEEQFPSHVVCQWMGNSQQVARKHYLQVTDEHYAEAVEGARSIFVASTASHGAANEKCDASETAQSCKVSQCTAKSVGDTGPEPVPPSLPSKGALNASSINNRLTTNKSGQMGAHYGEGSCHLRRNSRYDLAEFASFQR